MAAIAVALAAGCGGSSDGAGQSFTLQAETDVTLPQVKKARSQGPPA